MSDDMGTFRTTIEVENPARRGARITLENVLVDTGAELSWIPGHVLEELGVEPDKRLRFRQANGTVLERWTGFVIIHAGGTRTADDAVFGESDDMILLGARTLEGLNLRVDPVLKQLVDAGPAPAAFAG
jgi:predicted aspartyl protease